MGIFDIIECKQHAQAIGEYIFYLADSQNDKYPLSPDHQQVVRFMSEHLRMLVKTLESMENNS